MEAAKVSRSQRAYDHLYDPVYTVSCRTDHARADINAKIKKVPEFKSMFSNLPHHPAYTLRLETKDPVPAFIDRRWQGQTEQRREALQQLAGFVPRFRPRPEVEDNRVMGADRWKYFKRPLIPFAQQIPTSVVFALPKENFAPAHGENAGKQGSHTTVGVQTDYRESEAQTDPYSPDYVVKSGTTVTELLTLASLTSGHGLPAGLAEVEMIERARAKRAREATLPPLDDLSQLDKRKRMMEEMEIEEWAFREEQIEKLQESRLAVLRDMLRQREEAQQEVTSERLSQLRSKKRQDTEAKLLRIHKDYITSLRQIMEKRRNVEGKLERGDVVLDYARHCVQMYTSLTSKGVFDKTSTRKDAGRKHYLETYEGLLEVEAGLSSAALKQQAKTNKVSKSRTVPSESKELALLEKFQTLTKKEKVKKMPPRYLVKIEKPAPRPSTPRVDEPPEGEEERELAVIHFQKLLRGRSIQYQMFKGKEMHLDLIQELRSIHALRKEEEALKKAEKEHTLNLQKQRDLQLHKTSQEESLRDRLVGAELQHLFDTLSKELIHLQEERRIHAFSLLADREYRLRNAAEGGRRQAEDSRRREEDEIFRQVVKIHQSTVDCYLEDIILETVEKTADRQAREEIQKKAKEVNDLAYALEESMTNPKAEEIVAEMVYSFLLPDTQRSRLKQSVRQKQQKYLQMAQQIIYGEERPSSVPCGTQVESSPSPPSASGGASSKVQERVPELESQDPDSHQQRED